MNFNKALTAIVVAVFMVVLAVVLLRDSDGEETPQATPISTDGPQETADTMVLSFVTSSAKKSWVEQAVAEFNAKSVRVGNKAVVVKAKHVNSGASWEAIRDGSSKPDIWSPGDESWVRIANEGWKSLHNKALFPKADPLVNVPLCIAMWEPMAVALGYPKPLGWSDLVEISNDPQGWASHGHPEWGSFKWGHAHPDANSGFLTVVAEVYAHLQKTKDLTVADLKNPSLLAALKAAEHSVEHYGLSNSWIDTFMREKGPAYLSAAVQYENAIIEGNQKTQNRPFKVVAIYPKEGTFITQHPAGIPDAEWITPERREASEKFLEFLLSEPVQTAAMKLGLRPIAKSVAIADPFLPQWGVSPEMPDIPTFDVPSEDILKRITDLWHDAKKPASVMLVIDTSGSMAGDPMEKAKEGAAQFISRMHPRDELEVRAFNNVITRLTPADAVAKNGEESRQRVLGLFANGGTHLYEVVREAAVEWAARKKNSPDRHYGIVVLTDGQDEGSQISRADLMDVLPQGDNPETIKIFTIAYGDRADKLFLQELSNRSNARTFESTASDISRVYKELSANF